MTQTVFAKLALPAVLALALAACGDDSAAPDAAAPAAPAETAPATTEAPAPATPTEVDALVDAEHRSEEHRARNEWRHPVETLEFFGFAPDQTVVEVTPGGAGWYAEILAPALSGSGRYIGVVVDPTAVESEGAQAYYSEQNQKLRDKFAAHPELYGNATLVEIDPKNPSIAEPGSADLVLTFRNVHNWINAEQADAMFAAFHEVLKPGGVLGVVEHRAAEGSEYDRSSGYVTEQRVIELATAAGFELAERSDINANPADTKDHPNGVWTLPPTRRTPEGEDPAKYEAIGESDRMTLKFVKPAQDAAGAAQAEGSGD